MAKKGCKGVLQSGPEPSCRDKKRVRKKTFSSRIVSDGKRGELCGIPRQATPGGSWYGKSRGGDGSKTEEGRLKKKNALTSLRVKEYFPPRCQIHKTKSCSSIPVSTLMCSKSAFLFVNSRIGPLLSFQHMLFFSTRLRCAGVGRIMRFTSYCIISRSFTRSHKIAYYRIIFISERKTPMN